MKRSVGVLPYKIENGELMVYLEHPGGPFWKGKDKWSICKGEQINENAICAAIREFKEESGFDVPVDKIQFLGSVKQKSNKLITIFSVLMDIDPKKMKSNTFSMEYPRGSGEIKEFYEMDEGRWFSLEIAKEKIFVGQRKLLIKLQERYNNGQLI